nr:unnamed protein product [Callosobruchus analis]
MLAINAADAIGKFPNIIKSFSRLLPNFLCWFRHIHALHLVDNCLTNLLNNYTYSTKANSITVSYCGKRISSCQKSEKKFFQVKI